MVVLASVGACQRVVNPRVPGTFGRRRPADRSLRRAQGLGGQIGLQRPELAQRRRGIGALAALVELVDRQAPDRRVVAQRGDGALAVGVRSAKVRHTRSIVIPGRRSREER
jgi:hypothetical protein